MFLSCVLLLCDAAEQFKVEDISKVYVNSEILEFSSKTYLVTDSNLWNLNQLKLQSCFEDHSLLKQRCIDLNIVFINMLCEKQSSETFTTLSMVTGKFKNLL